MNGHTRLVRRKATYYFRTRIPENLVYLAGRKEFCYSLKTHNYYEALALVKKESYKVELTTKLLRVLDMRIKNGELLLDDVDVDKLIISKLKEVETLFENHYDEILNGCFSLEQTKVFSPERIKEATADRATEIQTPELQCVELFIKEYFEGIFKDKRAPIQTIKMIGRLSTEDVKIIAHPEQPDEWVINTKNALKGVDDYIDKNTCSIQKGTNLIGINQRVRRCLHAIEQERNTKALSESNTRTPWQRIFKDFAQMKKNNKVSINTINENETCLNTAFAILNKKYIENITYQDCDKLSKLIYNLPRRWQNKYKSEELPNVVKKQNDKCISLTSVHKYLRIFKEFLQYCKKKRYIKESFRDDFDMPPHKNQVKVDGFTPNELKKIFNPSFYPPKNHIYYAWRYWIPLIAIYTGMRLNEICQLYVDDVKYNHHIWYFKLTDERDDQHLKNKQSKRIVPIHPKLIELGFIDYVKELREAKKSRIFYQFVYSPKNHYTHSMSMWFARYLKRLDIEGRNKVFHSFRHTTKPNLRDCGISQEYQNAICGWVASDIGERVYGGEIPVKKLYDEICKLDYPFLNRTLSELKKLNEKGK